MGSSTWRDMRGWHGPATDGGVALSGPRDLVISANSETIYIAEYSTNYVGKYTISTASYARAVTKPDAAASGATAVFLGVNDDYLYVLTSTGTFAKYQTSNMAQVATVSVGTPAVGPLHCCRSPDGVYAYVLNTLQPQSVTRVTLATMTAELNWAIPSVSAGQMREIVASPDGAYLYIACGTTIQRVTCSTGEMSGTWEGLPSPTACGLALNKAGTRLLVTNYGTDAAQLSEVDMTSVGGAVRSVAILGPTVDNSYGVAYSPDESLAFVCCVAAAWPMYRIVVATGAFTQIDNSQQCRMVRVAPNGRFAAAVVNTAVGAIRIIAKTP